MDTVMDSDRVRVKISQAIVQGAEVLNTHRHMLRAITIKCDRMMSTPKHVVSIEDYEEEEIIVDYKIEEITSACKKERWFKSHMNLSIR